MNKKLKKYIVAISFFVVVQICMGMFLFANEVKAEALADPDKRDYVLPKLNFAIGDFGKEGNGFAELERQRCNEINGFTALQKGKGNTSPWCYTVPWLGQYVEALYKYGLIIGSVLATLMVIVGGFLYMTSGLNPSGREKGKQMIISSVVGLVLLMGSYTLLKIINPTLTELPSLTIEAARPIVLPPAYCEDIENVEKEYGKTFKIGDPIKPDTDVEDPGCGDEFKVELLNAQVAEDRAIAPDAKCVYSACRDATNGCVEENDKFTCKPALFYGSISKYREGLLLLDGGLLEMTGYIQDDGGGFSMRLFDPTNKSLNGAGKPVGYNEKDRSYYFARNSATDDALNRSADNVPVFLQIRVNTPHLFVGIGSYKTYYSDYKGAPIKYDYIPYTAVSDGCCTYTSNDTISTKAGCKLYTVGALKQKALRVDIDTSNHFANGETLEGSVGMKCGEGFKSIFTPIN